MNLRVAKIDVETHDTKTFHFVDHEEGGRQFDFFAGQYLTFRYDEIAAKPLVRSYTISSSPCQEDRVGVTVKRIEGGAVSNWMCDHLQEGSILRARGPIGRFCYDPANDQPHLVMVAGGSGMTPFISIMRQYAPTIGQPGSPASMSLLLSYRSQKDLILWSDLCHVAAQTGCKVVTTLSREDASAQGFWHGRIDDAMIERFMAGIPAMKSTFMTCGPNAIMDVTVAYCNRREIPDAQVKLESFEN